MYNPFDLIDISINNKPISGRPVLFDSEIVNYDSMVNAFGTIVKPTRLSTTCPDCGQGLLIDVVFDNPPFSLKTNCYLCNPVKVEEVIVINPVTENKIRVEELDPSINKVVSSSESTTVAERMEIEKTKKKKSKKKKPKKKSELEVKINDPEKEYKKDVEWNMEEHTYEKREEVVEESLEDLLAEEEVENFEDDDLVE